MELPEGLIAVVKRDCPTCNLVVPVLRQLATQEQPLTVYSQDDPGFPDDTDVINDTALAYSAGLRRVFGGKNCHQCGVGRL